MKISPKTWFEKRSTSLAYISGTDALWQLMRFQDKDIVKISPKGYTLSNGVEYCCVGLNSKDGTSYSVQAYGKDAIELHEEATVMVKNQ